MGPEQAVDDAMQRICAGSVSTHALREESDLQLWIRMPSSAEFQSTLSVGRVTHALQGIRENLEYFNPRPPRGERHSTYGQKTKKEKFQSTPSARRATYCFFNKFFFKVISIHALREESDFGQTLEGSANIDFNPRPPRGGRRLVGLFPLCRLSISIHALREEGDTCS